MLYANALKPNEIESKVLPQYEKFGIEHDVYTFQHLTKMYLNTLDLDKIYELYKSSQEAGIKPNKAMLTTVLEAGLRKSDGDLIYECLEGYLEIGMEPHPRQL